MGWDQWTVIIGVGVASLAYLIKSFAFDPLQRYREVVGRLDSDLAFFANVFTEGIPEDTGVTARTTLRRASGDLAAAYNAIGLRWVLKLCGLVPRADNVRGSCRALIRLSNSVGSSKIYDGVRDPAGSVNQDPIDEIRKSLRMASRW